MMVAAVACIDKRNAGVLGSKGCGTFPRMAHGDNIGILGYGTDGVCQALPFGRAAGVGFGKPEYASAQTKHRGFKAQAGSRAGFKEQGGQYFPFTFVHIRFRMVDNGFRQGKHFVQFLFGEVHRIHQITVFEHRLSSLS
jgi:hypothetical protein